MSGEERTETVGAFLARARQRIDRLDARLLLERVAGLTHARVIVEGERTLSSDQLNRLEELLERRASGEPLAYLLGHAEFLGRRYAVTPDVLIPRPETEELVELALGKLNGIVSPCAADLGTGSGVIAISLALGRPGLKMIATDRSAAALAVAEANAASLGAEMTCRPGDWLAPLAGERLHLIVSNPPYVAAGDPHLQQNGLPYEPIMALTDGGDGLGCLRTIVGAAPAHLLPGGWLLLEHGYDQGEGVRNLLCAAGFQEVFTKTDLAGIDRISGGRQPQFQIRETA